MGMLPAQFTSGSQDELEVMSQSLIFTHFLKFSQRFPGKCIEDKSSDLFKYLLNHLESKQEGFNITKLGFSTFSRSSALQTAGVDAVGVVDKAKELHLLGLS